MSELRERRFPDFEIVRTDEVSLYFRALVRGFKIAPLGVSEERFLTKGLLVFIQPRSDVAGFSDVCQLRFLPFVPDAVESCIGRVSVKTFCQSIRFRPVEVGSVENIKFLFNRISC